MITRQRLAGATSKPTPDGILDVARDLGFLQLDPTSVVAPSHQLVVFSRVGPYQPKHLETLLWDERRLFESWAHAASIVLIEHYPIYRWIMQRVGQLMVAGRSGGQKLWDLPERSLPPWTPKTRLGEPAIVRWAAEISLRALGVASPGDIREHLIRWKYVNLPAALALLEKQGRILPVGIRDTDGSWPGTWYVHADDLALLDRVEAGGWQPRTTLLSPFDNLIIDRRRTSRMFGFD